MKMWWMHILCIETWHQMILISEHSGWNSGHNLFQWQSAYFTTAGSVSWRTHSLCLKSEDRLHFRLQPSEVHSHQMRRYDMDVQRCKINCKMTKRVHWDKLSDFYYAKWPETHWNPLSTLKICDGQPKLAGQEQGMRAYVDIELLQVMIGLELFLLLPWLDI